MKKLNQYLLTVCVSTLCGSLSSTLYAGQTIYQLRDSNGTTLLTNKKNKYNNLKVEKKTYYPDSNIHSYSNWGASEASVLPSYSKSRDAYDHYIRQAAQAHGISEGLIKAVMHTESGFNLRARSPVGAQGLMQLMPATAKRFNVTNAYDPQQNIYAGAKYLAWLLKRFNGNTSLALAGYNAGEGNVAKYGGIPPFRETQDYVRRVTSRYNNLYAGGIGSSSTVNTPSNTRVIAQSQTPTSSDYSQQNSQASNQAYVQPAVARSSSRPIIIASDGSFTDAPAGSYSTEHATATAKIYISH